MPAESRIRTDHSRTPGATPTTPMPLSSAPTVPATWVPWPLGSPQLLGLSVEHEIPPAMLRSSWALVVRPPIPVSTIATSASTCGSAPLMSATRLSLPLTRRTPVGMDWPAMEMISSGTMASTVRVEAERGELSGGELGREAVDRIPEGPVGGDPHPAGPQLDAVHALAVLEQDDVPPVRRERRHGGRVLGGCQRLCARRAMGSGGRLRGRGGRGEREQERECEGRRASHEASGVHWRRSRRTLAPPPSSHRVPPRGRAEYGPIVRPVPVRPSP